MAPLAFAWRGCAGRPARTASRRRGSGRAPSSTFARSAFSRLTRMSSGGRSASASPSATQSAPNRRSNRAASHSGTSARTCAGAAARSGAARRRLSSSESGSGAWASSARIAASPSAPRPRRQPRTASASARGVSAPITQAAGGAPAQRVVDDVADGGAVAGAGEAMGHAPVLQRLGDRAVARLDGVQNLDRRGQPSALSHARTLRSLTGRGGRRLRRSAT